MESYFIGIRRTAAARLTVMSTQEPRFAVCVRNEGYESSLELHKIYRLVPDHDADKEGDVRVVDESGEDYVYPAEWFVPIDVTEAVLQSLLHTL
jgi:hypothetical protein